MLTALVLACLVQSPLEVPDAVGRRPVRLRASGNAPQVIEGQLLDPEGRAIAGARLDALGIEGRRAWAGTDAEGRFRFERLPFMPEAFVTDAAPGSERGGARAEWNGVLDGTPLRLVAQQAHLTLEVVEARAFCVQLEPLPRQPWDVGDILMPADLPGHCLIRQGATYACGLWSSRFGLVEGIARSGVGRDYAAQPALALPGEPAQRGRVKLTIDVPRPGLKVVATLLAPLSRVELVDSVSLGHQAGERSYTLDLPEGSYRLRLRERGPVGFCEVPCWERYVLCDFELPITVVAGETLELHPRLGYGARLAVQVDAPGAEDIRVWHLNGSDGSGERPLVFEPPQPGRYIGEFDVLRPGVRWASRFPLPEGLQRLRITAGGFRSREVELRATGTQGIDLDVSLLALVGQGELEQLPAQRSERAR